MNYQPDKDGFYGEFGGAFIPEILFNTIEALSLAFNKWRNDDGFKAEYLALLKDYVGRPTPLYFAEKLSQKFKANVFLKREDLNHTGAHKINNTIGQILLAKRMGKSRIIAETGAGQHGVATATVCARMGMECIVYMGAVDCERQAQNLSRMEMLGAHVIPVKTGSQTLKDATNAAIRDWIAHANDTYYLIGSVIGPAPYPEMVAYFQSVISEEIKKQLKTKTGCAEPDLIVACVGGGSNAAGAFYHYLNSTVDLVAVEAAGCGIESGRSAATSVLGTSGIIHGCKTILMQTSDGQVVEPHSISAGLDYPGIGPLHAHLIGEGRISTVSITDDQAVMAGRALALEEGIIPALESAHALAALEELPELNNKTIVVNLSGRGDKDLEAYSKQNLKA